MTVDVLGTDVGAIRGAAAETAYVAQRYFGTAQARAVARGRLDYDDLPSVALEGTRWNRGALQHPSFVKHAFYDDSTHACMRGVLTKDACSSDAFQ